MKDRDRVSMDEIEAEDAVSLPNKEVMSLLDVNANVDLGLDLAAPVDLAVAANLNVAAPIEAAAAANVLSPDAQAVSLAHQHGSIDQGISGSARRDRAAARRASPRTPTPTRRHGSRHRRARSGSRRHDDRVDPTGGADRRAWRHRRRPGPPSAVDGATGAVGGAVDGATGGATGGAGGRRRSRRRDGWRSGRRTGAVGGATGAAGDVVGGTTGGVRVAAERRQPARRERQHPREREPDGSDRRRGRGERERRRADRRRGRGERRLPGGGRRGARTAGGQHLAAPRRRHGRTRRPTKTPTSTRSNGLSACRRWPHDSDRARSARSRQPASGALDRAEGVELLGDVDGSGYKERRGARPPRATARWCSSGR